MTGYMTHLAAQARMDDMRRTAERRRLIAESERESRDARSRRPKISTRRFFGRARLA